MLTAAMQAVFALKSGNRICARLPIDKSKVSNWKYAGECPQNFPMLTPGSVLEIFELSATPGSAWVKAYIPNTLNTMFLKISGEELANNFQLVIDYDVDAATRYLGQHAAPKSTHHCAAYVRAALEAGGLDMTQRPNFAKDYGPYLTRLGFKTVAATGYRPQKGDIAVIQNYAGGDAAGHVTMYDGTCWISDFKQTDMWSGQGYREKKPGYTIYRP
jgi:hypothetical protein